MTTGGTGAAQAGGPGGDRPGTSGRPDGTGRADAAAAELFERACLLEIARVAADDPEPAALVESVADILMGALPVRALSATIAVGPAVHTVSRGRPGPAAVEVRAGRDGGPRVAMSVDTTFAPDLLRPALERIGAGILEVVTGPGGPDPGTLGARAAALAASLDEHLRASDLDRIAAVLARMGGVTSVEITAPGGRPRGRWAHPGPRGERRLEIPVGGGHLTVRFTELPEGGVRALGTASAALRRAFERLSRHRMLAEDAELDPVCGVGNRRRADRALEAAVNLARRQHLTAALLLIRVLDADEADHRVAPGTTDALLARTARALADAVRSYDTVARWDEHTFAVICPATDPADLPMVASRLRSEVRDAARALLPAGWDPTVAVGWAHGTGARAVPDELTRRSLEVLSRPPHARPAPGAGTAPAGTG